MQSVSRLDTIADLPAMLREGDLLLLDVDETLVRSEPDATEPWFNAFVDALSADVGVAKAVPPSPGVWGASPRAWACRA